MNVPSPHKWWSTLTSAVFGSSSSLPPLVSEGGGMVYESFGKADLLSDHFDIKQSMEDVDLLLTCHLLLTCQFYHLCVQVERGEVPLVRLGPLWWH